MQAVKPGGGKGLRFRIDGKRFRRCGRGFLEGLCREWIEVCAENQQAAPNKGCAKNEVPRWTPLIAGPALLSETG